MLPIQLVWFVCLVIIHQPDISKPAAAAAAADNNGGASFEMIDALDTELSTIDAFQGFLNELEASVTSYDVVKETEDDKPDSFRKKVEQLGRLDAGKWGQFRAKILERFPDLANLTSGVPESLTPIQINATQKMLDDLLLYNIKEECQFYGGDDYDYDYEDRAAFLIFFFCHQTDSFTSGKECKKAMRKMTMR